MIKTMMKVSGLSRAQLEAMGEEKFFAKYGQQLKQEMGGNMQPSNMKQYAQGGQLTRFDEGGTHEENPLGGIPQGEDSQGVMNTVEQGETKKGNYVYSDRLSIDENMAKQLNLPGYIKGKSFANASKAIDNKFRDRSDQYSQETKKTLLDRLKQGQEALKQQEQQKAQQLAQAMQANSQQSPGMGNNQVPPGMEQFMQSPQEEMVEGAASNPQEEMMEQPEGQPMAYGGMMNRYDGGGVPDISPIGNTLKPAGQTLSGPTTMPTASVPTASQLNPTKGVSGVSGGSGLSGADALGYFGVANSLAEGDTKGAAMSAAQIAAAKGAFGAGVQGAMASAAPALGVVGAGMGAYQMGQMASGKVNRNKGKGLLQGAVTGAGAGSIGGAPGMAVGAALGMGAAALGHDAAGRNYGHLMGRHAKQMNSSYDDPNQIKSQAAAYGGYLNQHADGGPIKPGFFSSLLSKFNPSPKLNSLSSVNTNTSMPSSNLGMPANSTNYNNAFSKAALPAMAQPMAPSSMYSNRIEPGLRRTSPSLNLDTTINGTTLPSMKGISMPDYAGKFAASTTALPNAPRLTNKKLYKPGFFSSSDRFVDGTPVFGDKYKTGTVDKPSMLGKAGEFFKENYGEMLNAAPAVYNAYKALNPETSDRVAYSRLNDTYKKSYVDNAYLDNIAKEESNNTINALTNAAGGSNSALMSGYAGANLGRIKARNDAAFKVNEYDAEQNALKQKFDSEINIRNQGTDTAEKNAQAQNDATTRNMNREYAAAAMEGIGKFGKQQFDKKQIARTLGYDYKGGYIVDKQGIRVSPEDLAKAQANAKKLYEDTTATQANAYGGYLRTIKRMK